MLVTEEQIERLKHLATSAATDGRPTDQDEREYSTIRRAMLSDTSLTGRVPKFVTVCSTLKEVRNDIQPLGGYKERREHIRQAIAPLLSATSQSVDPFQAVVLSTDLSKLGTLPHDIQEKGKAGAKCYIYLFCIENTIREFIIKMTEGQAITMPKHVQAKISQRRAAEATRKYLPVRGTHDVYYCDFNELADIVKANWDVFAQYFPGRDEHWFKTMINELYAVRILIGHSSAVGDVELTQLDVFYRLLMSYLRF